MAQIPLKEVPQGEKFHYLGVEWERGDYNDLWIEATPEDTTNLGLYQQLWNSTEVEYTAPKPPPEKGELWSDGLSSRGGYRETVWFCTGESMQTANGASVPADTFRTWHRPSSTRLYPPAE